VLETTACFHCLCCIRDAEEYYAMTLVVITLSDKSNTIVTIRSLAPKESDKEVGHTLEVRSAEDNVCKR
jgi:hypothetical protein